MAVAIEKATFFEAIQNLSNEDRGKILTFVGKFQDDPSHPSLSLERVQRARNDNVWAARVSKELRAIAFKDGADWVLVYVDRHDAAYKWAENRSIERHSHTGDLQIVEIPTTAGDSDAVMSQRHGIFSRYDEDYLLCLGAPPSWLPVIRQISSEDELIEVLQKMPEDVAERLFDLASGKLVTPPDPIVSIAAAKSEEQSSHLFVIRTQDDLRPLLDAPMSKWIAFLHPTQRKLAFGDFNGAVKITGSAGTGKTVVAMHRAKHLAGQGKRVLLASFVNNLCHNLRRNLRLFCADSELRRITVSTVHNLALELLKGVGEPPELVKDEDLQRLLKRLIPKDCPLDEDSLFAEWRDVIQAQGVRTWDDYRGASRVGRGRPLTVKDRKAIWEVIARFHRTLAERGQSSFTGLCWRVLDLMKAKRIRSPFDAVIVDEAQDLGLPELRLLAALAGKGNSALMLVGDGGQRIYAPKHSLKSVGIDVRGRSHVLRLNYRTTEQIRRFADRILGDEADDLEGGRQSRRGARSLLSGPEPALKAFDSRQEQCDYVAEQTGRLLKIGRAPDEIAVFARQAYLLDMVETRLKRAGIQFHRLSKEDFPSEPMVSLGSMHRAKGLEFKFVFVIDVSDDQLPYAKVLERKTGEQSREDFIEQERQLFYVSLTRARDCVFVTWAGKRSRFLE